MTKVCNTCHREKDVSAFAKQSTNHDGLQGKCRSCYRDYTRLKNYGLTREAWLNMVLAQDLRCAICRKKFGSSKDIQVDHDHRCCRTVPTCGRCVRAILCADCNIGMGNFSDDATVLRLAADYLDLWSGAAK